MKNNDAELIRLTLNGNDAAFAELMNKYKRAVHALVWRKIEDFHVAEEITQDIFLRAYQKLGTLKKPQCFASWIYVIASRRCLAWQRKKRMVTIPLDDTCNAQDEEATYSEFVVNENQRVSEDAQRDVVKKLLAKLPESERTVITLHYFSEMSSTEIGAFLGVSANTIRSRLRRAQQRLQKEETMIREALEHFQISPFLTDNVMQEVSRLKTAPTGSKPFIPWAVAASSIVLIVLMLGIGSQFLAHFQKPYSLDAQAETTIELVDTPVVLNLETQQDKRNKIVNANEIGNNTNHGQKPEDVFLAAEQTEGVKVSAPTQQWIQSEPIKGSPVLNLHATPEGDIYALGDEMHLYKLPVDSSEWQYQSDVKSLPTAWAPSFPIAKWKNTLYILPSNGLFASKDDGKTWELIYSWEDRYGPNTIIGIEDTLYVAFGTGIFRTENSGKTWKEIKDGLKGTIIRLFKFQDLMFAATDIGLFRLNADSWERIELPYPTVGRIHSIASAGGKLYVAAEVSFDVIGDPARLYEGLERGWWIFRSTDLGNTWKDITPTNAWPLMKQIPKITLLAAGNTLIAMEQGMVRSIDAGETWMPPTSIEKYYFSPAVTHNDQVFYVGGKDGLHRSIDDGKSWGKVYIPQEKEKSPIEDLIIYSGNDKKQYVIPNIYVRYGGDARRLTGEIAETTDNGKSWQRIQMEIQPITQPERNEQPSITHLLKYNGEVYAKGGHAGSAGRTRLYRVSQNNRKLELIRDIPLFDEGMLYIHYVFQIHKNYPKEFGLVHEKRIKEMSFGATQFFKRLKEIDQEQPDRNAARVYTRELFSKGFWGPFALSNETIYIEYNFKLFRCKRGDAQWHDTGLEETVELTSDVIRRNLKLVVSGDTVYVGKRDGHLFVSYNKGDNWTDLTPALPFLVNTFKDIIVDGSTAYVATDTGIITTHDGRNWQTITDADGTNLIMERLAVDNSVLYGVTKKSGIYRIENGVWKQVVSNNPDNVTSLAVTGNTIYVGTEYNEMLHFNLEDNTED